MDNELTEKNHEKSPDERVLLAEWILAGIDHEGGAIRQRWIAEVKNRMNAVKEGRSNLLGA